MHHCRVNRVDAVPHDLVEDHVSIFQSPGARETAAAADDGSSSIARLAAATASGYIVAGDANCQDARSAVAPLETERLDRRCRVWLDALNRCGDTHVCFPPRVERSSPPFSKPSRFSDMGPIQTLLAPPRRALTSRGRFHYIMRDRKKINGGTR